MLFLATQKSGSKVLRKKYSAILEYLQGTLKTGIKKLIFCSAWESRMKWI
jgi:hypothetical protein